MHSHLWLWSCDELWLFLSHWTSLVSSITF
jgi:hypothetical protein